MIDYAGAAYYAQAAFGDFGMGPAWSNFDGAWSAEMAVLDVAIAELITKVDTTRTNHTDLPGIEQSVNAGKLVPIDVTNGKEGHQMLVIGHDGDKLEVYNPWGYTSWVSESQFVNNQLGSLTTNGGDGSLKTADGLELPQ